MKVKEHRMDEKLDMIYPSRLLYLPGGTARLEKIGTPVKYPKNHILIEPGNIPEYCYVVKHGRVITSEYTPGGEERVYNFMEEQSIFLECNLLMQDPVPVFFMTAKPSELIAISRGALLTAMGADPQLNFDIIESISLKFLAAMDQIRESTTQNASWKLVNLLLIFAERFGEPYDGKILIKEKVSQQMLSNLLGISRITTVRIIKDLKELWLVEQINGYYCIRDIDKLKQHLTYLETHMSSR
jgi:CRP/FNR family cyclic AMP-dependent transcriptional regulator